MGEIVLRHQWKAACIGVFIIAITTYPAFSMKTGFPLIGSLSQVGPAAEAFHELEQNGIPSAIDLPIQIMTHGGAPGLNAATALAKSTPGVCAVISPDIPSYRRGEDALLTVHSQRRGKPRQKARQLCLACENGWRICRASCGHRRRDGRRHGIHQCRIWILSAAFNGRQSCDVGHSRVRASFGCAADQSSRAQCRVARFGLGFMVFFCNKVMDPS